MEFLLIQGSQYQNCAATGRPQSPLPTHGQNPESKLPRGASLVTQMVKNLPATQETRVRSLGGEDPLEKGVATHSSIPA